MAFCHKFPFFLQTSSKSSTFMAFFTHICVAKLTITDSDNGLSPGRRQAIIVTIAGILLFGPLETNFCETLIGIYTFSFKKMHLKMSSAKCGPFCFGLNVLMNCSHMCLLDAIEYRSVNSRWSWDVYVSYYDLGNVQLIIRCVIAVNRYWKKRSTPTQVPDFPALDAGHVCHWPLVDIRDSLLPSGVLHGNILLLWQKTTQVQNIQLIIMTFVRIWKKGMEYIWKIYQCRCRWLACVFIRNETRQHSNVGFIHSYDSPISKSRNIHQSACNMSYDMSESDVIWKQSNICMKAHTTN